MKQLIVLLSSLLLGFRLVALLIGPGEESLAFSLRTVWVREAQVRCLEDPGPPGP